MKKIMVRADDLGYSEAVNYGIAKTVKDGIIKNIGFMVNMDATEHGYELIRGEDVCLGLHTNISAGRPLCDPALVPSLVNEDGYFKSSKEYRTKEEFVVLDEVLLEIEQQYLRFKEITGREPSYFEAHAVQSENLVKGLEMIAEKYHLKYCEASLDGSPVEVNGQKMYLNLESFKPDYDPTEFFFRTIEQAHDDAFNLMIFHPGYLDADIIKNSSLTIPRVLEVETLCSAKIREYLEKNKIHLYTYDEV